MQALALMRGDGSVSGMAGCSHVCATCLVQTDAVLLSTLLLC